MGLLCTTRLGATCVAPCQPPAALCVDARAHSHSGITLRTLSCADSLGHLASKWGLRHHTWTTQRHNQLGTEAAGREKVFQRQGQGRLGSPTPAPHLQLAVLTGCDATPCCLQVGAPRWLACIVTTWGLTAMAFAFSECRLQPFVRLGSSICFPG